MNEQSYWVGLDAGLEKTSICVVDSDGCIDLEEICDSEVAALTEILCRYPPNSIKVITIEAGVGTHFVRDLQAQGYPIRVAEVRRSSKFLAVRRHKTDINDANGLADLGRVGRSIGTEVYVKPLECQNIRTRLIVRHNLVRQRTKTDALIQSIVRLHGGKLRPRSGVGALEADIESQLERLQMDGMDVDAEICPLVQIAELMRNHIAAMDRQMYATAKKHPICSLLLTMPGVGPITALSFYSAVGDPYRFTQFRDIGPYLGLTPNVHQSGVISRQGRISKQGNKLTRSHLVTAATVLLCKTRGDSALRTWGLELSKRVGLSKARVAVARKMAVILLRLWATGKAFDPAPT